jgi:hypothetical protein
MDTTVERQLNVCVTLKNICGILADQMKIIRIQSVVQRIHGAIAASDDVEFYSAGTERRGIIMERIFVPHEAVRIL